MKRLARTQFGNPILGKKTKKVSPKLFGSRSLKQLAKEMFFTMRRVGGVGLAAPQIGKSLQLAVIEIKKTPARPEVVPLAPTVVINPEILTTSKEKLDDWEGCLSFPNVRGLVPRHKSITVKYIDESGKKHVVKLHGFQARVFQHEIDHLKGTVYVDRIQDMQSLMTFREFKERVLGKGLKSK
ncbi:MAG: peptide deformylase [bacterium]|nr:peptide deformylase [bacterium]